MEYPPSVDPKRWSIVSQAKGVLPRDDERDLLRDPETCGYFIWARLTPDLDRHAAEQWFQTVSTLVEALVDRDSKDGPRLAAVAIGLSREFFARPFDPPLTPPAGFRPDSPEPLTLGGVAIDHDVFFYVATTRESRVSHFLEKLWLTGVVAAIEMERGYQRPDGREVFGYRDGLRNVVPRVDRPETVFLHRDARHLEEPAWADGGTYLAYMKIVQHRDTFTAVGDEAARDQLIGRTADGARLDLGGQKVEPAHEPDSFGAGLAANAHVRNAGPRTGHDDCQIFRRGLPFVETTDDGQVRVGLQFASFQASLEQFDVVVNDWIANPHFPSENAGADALLDPARELTTVELAAFAFVLPYESGRPVGASLFAPAKSPRPPRTGRLVIRKRIVDDTGQARRFERKGFGFRISRQDGTVVADSVTTDSTGRAVVAVELEIGTTYVIDETVLPVANISPTQTSKLMEHSHEELEIVNHVTTPNTPYSG
jgi:Dyp-type peroxidase family